MKLEYFPDGSPDCPLIRLYDFTLAEAEQLHGAVAELASGSCQEVEIHRLPGVESIGGCRLTFRVSRHDGAIVQIESNATFDCRFTIGTWDNVAGLIEPFTQNGDGFQWLAGVPGEANLLLSVSGQW
jgi:hypothetical protein